MTAAEGTAARFGGDPAIRREILGTNLDALTMDQVVARCVAAVGEERRLTIGVVNAAKIVNMRSDDLLRQSVVDCDLVLADGQSVVWASGLLGHRLPERVAGIDLFTELLAEGERRGHRVYLLGATPEVLERTVAEIRRRHPALAVAGSRDGYFTDDESERVAAEIADSKADLLFLGITSPKKEIFVKRWGAATGASVIHGVGGSFDILAGHTRRAPARWQRLGLEWFYRLLQEPMRLGPRYLKTNARFLLMVAAARLGRRRP
ncbi:WecB/TagA/CpsF family glycosyltransferase [Streptosporangium carneum]|nr:WecB/TagA/CpsF family glycosyltransferase [Streptosporangium carneum]